MKNGISSEQPTLQRKLKSRHLSMIAIGGSIGTGLFLASGTSISQAGPGGALLAYTLIGIMVYFLMTSLGEMSAYLPVSGSFSTYATRYVDPALGFALGWNYWFNWAITLAFDLVASAMIMNYWFPDVPPYLFSGIFLIIIISINALSVSAYGEAEFWFALIKVITVIVFLIAGVGLIFGIIGGEAIGFSNFTMGNAPFANGFLGVLGVFIVAGFSFQGTELVGIAAGETENPSKTIPIAIRQIFWRILLFYILAIAVIGCIIPYTSPDLLDGGVAVSPFTLVFEKIGIAFAASVMNAVILTSVLSAGTSGTYAAARMLYTLALDGKAPKSLGVLSKNGVPLRALLATAAVGSLACLTAFFGNGESEGVVYLWLLNMSGLSGFIAWLGIAISHYR
ncbi:MAG: amino acid permease, partial [Bacilli bacterium]